MSKLRNAIAALRRRWFEVLTLGLLVWIGLEAQRGAQAAEEATWAAEQAHQEAERAAMNAEEAAECDR